MFPGGGIESTISENGVRVTVHQGNEVFWSNGPER